jgi:hypothetical protein
MSKEKTHRIRHSRREHKSVAHPRRMGAGGHSNRVISCYDIDETVYVIEGAALIKKRAGRIEAGSGMCERLANCEASRYPQAAPARNAAANIADANSWLPLTNDPSNVTVPSPMVILYNSPLIRANRTITLPTGIANISPSPQVFLIARLI